MNVTDSIRIRSMARDLLLKGWAHRRDWWDTEPSVRDYLLQAPQKIAANLLGLTVILVEEIVNPAILLGQDRCTQIAGILDTREKTILVSNKFRKENAHFTLAHEIGHAVLHPSLVLHREIASKFRRTPQEREADLFAAEFVMPSKEVRAQFKVRFGNCITIQDNADTVAYWLSGEEEKLSPEELLIDDPVSLAGRIASTHHYHGQQIISLCEYFCVSKRAMSIQLLDLGLVK